MGSYAVQEFVCEDGSGTFVLKTHSRVDFAKPKNEQDTPTYGVESETGEYTDLSGSGEVSMDLAMTVRHTPEKSRQAEPTAHIRQYARPGFHRIRRSQELGNGA